eukprot:2858614-Alexandrium_andersonii.AAC.1
MLLGCGTSGKPLELPTLCPLKPDIAHSFLNLCMVAWYCQQLEALGDAVDHDELVGFSDRRDPALLVVAVEGAGS